MGNDEIVVTGASGTLGRALVPALTAAGYAVRGVSRRPRDPAGGVRWHVADLRAGSGVAAAVAGAKTVVHCATAPRGDEVATANLISALREAQPASHLVYVSIVGIDRVPLGYYRHKLAAEGLIASSGLRHTILRATQFHDLVLRLFTAQRRLPVLAVPAEFPFQPIAVADVAARLTELVGAGPSGRAADIGGPEQLPVADLARMYLEATGRRRRIVAVPVPGRIGRALRSGTNLTANHTKGVSFAEFVRAAASGV